MGVRTEAVQPTMNTPKTLEALRAAEEFLKIVLTYHTEGILLQGAPKKLRKEFAEALCIAGGKCSEAIAELEADNN
jgi:hypothetical protein